MKNLKKTRGWLVMAAALTLGLSACSSSEDSIIEQPVNPTESRVYTLVIKASKGGDGNTTRALKEEGGEIKAYWSGDETIEVYQNDVKIGTAEAEASPDNETTITAELTSAPNPESDLNFYLGGRTPDYTGQVGLLTGTNSISEKYDYAMDCLTSGTYSVDENNYKVTPNEYTDPLEFVDIQQAIIKFTLKDKGNSDALISPSALTVSDGTSTVSLTGIPGTTYTTNGDGVLYVAFPAAGSAQTITLTATMSDGETYAYTTPSAKTFWCGQYYEITVKMTRQPRTYDLSQATSSVTLKNGDTATGTMPTGMVYIADGATVTLNDVTVNYGISCYGSATINLEGANTVGGSGYSGITINHGTLTIQGSGSLTATGSDGGAGIGGASSNCHVVIKGGTIVAQGSAFVSVSAAGIGGCGEHFGNITIEGGDITAMGGKNAAGIGGGHAGAPSCGNISISGGTVRATGGANAAGIGCGYANDGTITKCGDITISGGTVTATAGTITDDKYPIVSAIGVAASLFQIGTVTVTGGINSVAMTNTNSIAGTYMSFFIHGNPLKIGMNTVSTSGPVGNYGFGTVRSTWNSSTKTWTLTKTGS